MASSPITSWQIYGKKVETVTDFIFLGSKITVDGDCSHEIKRGLLLGRKAKAKIDSVLKAETSLCWQRFIYSELWFFQSKQEWSRKQNRKEQFKSFQVIIFKYGSISWSGSLPNHGNSIFQKAIISFKLNFSREQVTASEVTSK